MNRVKLTPEIIKFIKNFKYLSYKETEEKETIIYDIEQFYFITVDEEKGIFDVISKYLALEIFMRDVRPNIKFEKKEEKEEVQKNKPKKTKKVKESETKDND